VRETCPSRIDPETAALDHEIFTRLEAASS
jgi:hypothetical protein